MTSVTQQIKRTPNAEQNKMKYICLSPKTPHEPWMLSSLSLEIHSHEKAVRGVSKCGRYVLREIGIGGMEYLSYIRMNLATKASRWNITFCIWEHGLVEFGGLEGDSYTAHANSVLVECGPFNYLRFQCFVGLRY